MSRNKEKQLGALNRISLQKDRLRQEEKNPTRPKLHVLTTSVELRRWMPSIRRDIEITLSQTRCTSYSHKKICELHTRINQLRVEYLAFLKKLRSIEGDDMVAPGTLRPYQSHSRTTDTIQREIELKNKLATAGSLPTPSLSNGVTEALVQSWGPTPLPVKTKIAPQLSQLVSHLPLTLVEYDSSSDEDDKNTATTPCS